MSSEKDQKLKSCSVEFDESIINSEKNKISLQNINLSATAKFAETSIFNYESSNVYSPKKHDLLGRQFNIICSENSIKKKKSNQALQVYNDYKKTRETAKAISSNVGSLSQYMINHRSETDRSTRDFKRNSINNDGSYQMCYVESQN